MDKQRFSIGVHRLQTSQCDFYVDEKPLEVREAKPEKALKVNKLGLLLPKSLEKELKILIALEAGR